MSIEDIMLFIIKAVIAVVLLIGAAGLVLGALLIVWVAIISIVMWIGGCVDWWFRLFGRPGPFESPEERARTKPIVASGKP